jgi:hypothetical protein
MERIQVLLDPEERELFRRLARQRGLSLSAWLRDAGLRRAAEEGEVTRMRTVEALRAFFVACDQRETGREPDWEEHLAVLDASKRDGVGSVPEAVAAGRAPRIEPGDGRPARKGSARRR